MIAEPGKDVGRDGSASLVTVIHFLVRIAFAKDPEELPTSMKKRMRRNDEQLISDLQAKIEAIKARAARKEARGNPSVRFTIAAVKSLEKAAGATEDAVHRKALEEARSGLSAWLSMSGIAMPAARRGRKAAAPAEDSQGEVAAPRRRARAAIVREFGS